jgi:hypothetical protein
MSELARSHTLTFQPTGPERNTDGIPMNLRFMDWIWHIKGSVELPPEQKGNEAFDRLMPLFREVGTTHERTGDTLTFSKKDPAAQDKMSIFDRGVLQIDQGATGPVLRYRLASRALLCCFLAPLLFLAFAQLTIAVGKLEGPSKQAVAEKSDKKAELPQHPIDKALGSPAPEKPKKDKAKDDDDKPSPKAAYIFAAIFAALYVVGRVLEERLVKRLFNKSLLGV